MTNDGNDRTRPPTDDGHRTAPSNLVPGYEVLEEIGRGGMGVVYRARDPQFDRNVAIKLLGGSAAANSTAAARFRTEARITGQLQHPGIPAVHELGTLADGRPFLVMKLVKGQTLQKLLDERADPATDRGRFIAIFEHLCQAVGFAHAHLVLHRDLKPSNVMVGAFGEVQVMDWGLAKALSGDPAAEPERDVVDQTTMPYVSAFDTPEAGSSATRTGSVLGTPAYMPPEQAGGEIRKLDARSDVFGLGAVLCQILTGKPPYQGKDGNDTRIKAVRGELQEALARLDSCGAEPDLLSLAKRCLSIHQKDRPADGQAVADEVGRIRTQAEARARQAELERASALVREGEQVRRRRQFLLAASVVAAVMSLGIVGTTVGLFRARQATAAEQKAKEAALAAAAAEQQAKLAALNAAAAETAANLQAQKRLAQLQKGNEILTGIFVDLDIRKADADPDRVATLLAKRLVKAAEQLEGESIGDPLMVAGMQIELARSLLSLGYAPEAIPLFVKSRNTFAANLGAADLRTLACMNDLAASYLAAGKLDLALPLFEETLKHMQAQLGADHPDSLRSLGNLAAIYQQLGKMDLALPLCEQTMKLKKAKLGADHPETLVSMNNLAMCYPTVGRLDLALPLLEETLRRRKATLGAVHPDTLNSMDNLAMCYQVLGNLELSLSLKAETLKLKKAELGANHPLTLLSMNNLAGAYLEAGKLDLAIPLLKETVELTKAKLGADHPNTLTTMSLLAGGYQNAGQLDLALPLFEEVLTVSKAKLGADHPMTLSGMSNLGGAHQQAGKPELALALFLAAAEGVEKRQFQHEDAGGIVREAAGCLEQLEKYGPAESWRRKWLGVVKQRNGADSQPYAQELSSLGDNLLHQKKWAAAEPVLRECLALREQRQPDYWTTFNTKSLLGAALLGQQQYAAAEPLLLQGSEGLIRRAASMPPQGKKLVTESLQWLVQLYEALERPDELAKWRKELEAR